jgi:hypothetical protein
LKQLKNLISNKRKRGIRRRGGGEEEENAFFNITKRNLK